MMGLELEFVRKKSDDEIESYHKKGSFFLER